MEEQSKAESLKVKGYFLFEFKTMSQWVNKASSWFKPYQYGGYVTVCLDKNNNVCHIGEDFMRAEKDDLFPVKVYALQRTAKYTGESLSVQEDNIPLIINATIEWFTDDTDERTLSQFVKDTVEQFSETITPVEFGEWILKEAILPRDTNWFDAGKYFTTKELYDRCKNK